MRAQGINPVSFQNWSKKIAKQEYSYCNYYEEMVLMRELDDAAYLTVTQNNFFDNMTPSFELKYRLGCVLTSKHGSIKSQDIIDTGIPTHKGWFNIDDPEFLAEYAGTVYNGFSMGTNMDELIVNDLRQNIQKAFEPVSLSCTYQSVCETAQEIRMSMPRITQGAGNTGSAQGYYQDANGRWHRPNGQFASNAEIGMLQSTKSVTSGAHGNSLACTKTNYGYVLVDKNTGEILKFGETLYPNSRYSKAYLNSINAEMRILEIGSKEFIHNWQYDMNSYYKFKYGQFPPLNNKGW